MGLGALLEKQLGHLPNFQKLHTFSISTSGVEIELIFHSMSSSFLDRCRFSKWPYLGMKLGKCPKFQKLHVYPLSTLEGSKLTLFLLYGQRFPRDGPIFKIAIFGHETWQMARSCTCILFVPQGFEIEFIFAL